MFIYCAVVIHEIIRKYKLLIFNDTRVIVIF